MKFNSFKSVLFLLTVVILSSCLGTNDPVVTSDDPSFVSLTFAANDSIPNIEDAVFTLIGDTIQNVDSLPFNTRIDSVNPTFSFTSTYAAVINEKTYLTGTDTIDFSLPVKLKNFASDGIAFKEYIIKVNVHQVDPELYIYKKLTDISESVSIVNQKTVILNNKIFYFRNNGTTNYLSTSLDGSAWSSMAVTGLPAAASLHDMLAFGGKLYLSHGGNIYSSSDGSAWITAYTSSEYSLSALLFTLNGKMWSIAQSKNDQKYHFANSVDGGTLNVIGVIPSDFPVSDFASVSFTSRSGKTKAIVVGGKSSTGATLKTNWSTEDGTYWLDFSADQNHSLDTLALGASVISYDKKLLLYGTENNIGSSLKNHFKQSIDEGLTWQTPDSASNVLPVNYPARTYQSVVVDQSNRIYIVGGKSGSTVLSDVWTGKLNRKSFIIQ